MPAVRTVKIIAVMLVGFFCLLPHAALALGLDDAIALNQQVLQLYSQGRYSEAIPLAQRTLAIVERALGPEHPNVATALNNLADLYQAQGRYPEAVPLYKRSLAIWEKALGPDHPDVALSLNNLAGLYLTQGRYADVEALFKRSLAIREKTLGLDHPDVAQALNNLAGLYDTQGRYSDAEPLYKRSLAIREKVQGKDHPDVAVSLTNLAGLYRRRGRLADTESLEKRSLAIREKALGHDHPDVAQSLNNLGSLYDHEGRYVDAEALYKRSLAILQKALGPEHPKVATALNNLAELYRAQDRYPEAEPLYKRSLAIREKALGHDHPDVAQSLNNLGSLYDHEGRYADAEALYKRSLAIWQKALGPEHPDVATALNNLAGVYKTQERYADAEPLYKRSLVTWEKAHGPDSPDVATSLNNLANLYDAQGRYADAEALYKRSLAIREKVFGPNHPDVALSLNNLAAVYKNQRRYPDAEALYKRSLVINEKTFGPGHPDVARTVNNLGSLYYDQERYADALPFVKGIIAQNTPYKSVILAVMYASQNQKLISPTEALALSYTVFQYSASPKAAEAVSKLAPRFAAGTNELAQLVRKDQDLTAEADRLDKVIIAAISKPPVERSAATEDQIRKRIEKIKAERDKLQDVFNQRFPAYAALSKPRPLTIEQTQALLADDEAIVTIDLDKKSYVWVITKDRAEWRELSVTAEDISKEVWTLRTGLNPDAPKPFDLEIAYQLYQQVLGPIEEIISQKTRLSFVLDGALTSLPPQVLITTEPKGKDFASLDWLVRKYAVTVLPSIASLKVLRDEKSTVAAIKPMIGFGDPVFDRTTQTAGRPKVAAINRSLTSFYRGMIPDTNALAEALPALPETADELRAIAKILGAKSEDIKLGEAASVTDIKHELLSNYRVVYFATHALVAGEVEKFAKVKAEPALVLSIPEKPTEDDDGLLRASDVALLNMNANFVVLSACNTAAGDKPGAEALSGLARAFFYAGARSLIVSNWEVDSESTVALMIGLFDALKANPHLAHAEALQVSMLRMIVKARVGAAKVLGTFHCRWRAAKKLSKDKSRAFKVPQGFATSAARDKRAWH
jgi:CHAT domain-containing protein/Tfp pilus assembly protein PilF